MISAKSSIIYRFRLYLFILLIVFLYLPLLVWQRTQFFNLFCFVEQVESVDDFIDEDFKVLGYPRLDKGFAGTLGVSLYLKEYNLHQCYISKNMETAGCAVTCYLSNTTEYAKLMKLESVWVPGKPSRPCHDQIKVAYDVAANMSENVKHYAVIRHPLKRLVSGYLYVCGRLKQKCYGCYDKDFECFVERNYYHLSSLTKLDGLKRQFFHEYHFYPQYWFCGLYKYHEKYSFTRYGHGADFISRYLSMYERSGVPAELLKTAATALQNKTTRHVTAGDDRAPRLLATLYANDSLLRFAVNTYFRDFQLFDFDLRDDDDAISV